MSKKFDPWILMFFGLPFITAVIFLSIAFYGFKANSAHSTQTIGIITNVSKMQNRIPQQYSFVVGFYTKGDNKRVYFRSKMSGSSRIYSKGDQVDVIYDEDDPSNAEIKGFVINWFAVVIFGALGTIFLAMSLLFFPPIWPKSKNKKHKKKKKYKKKAKKHNNS